MNWSRFSNPLSRSMPRNVQLWAWFGGDEQRVADPAEFLVKAVLSGVRQPSLVLRRGREHESVGGIDFEVDARGEVPGFVKKGDRAWYWPATAGTGELCRGEKGPTHRQPRWSDLRSALVESMKVNGDAAYVIAWSRSGTLSARESGCFAIRRRADWFDDPDRLASGTVERWWRDWFARATVEPPRLWRGDDDSLE